MAKFSFLTRSLVEQDAKSFKMTSQFDEITNKIDQPKDKRNVLGVWPSLGENFVLNEFYRHWLQAEGWVGQAYLMIWSPREVEDFRAANVGSYPDKYHFFASDGGGRSLVFLLTPGAQNLFPPPMSVRSTISALSEDGRNLLTPYASGSISDLVLD